MSPEFELFLIGFLISVLAVYMKQPIVHIFSSVYFMASSAYIVLSGQGWTFPTFFILFGLVILYHGLSEIIALSEQKKNKNEFEEYE